MERIRKIKKRDGRTVEFNIDKISDAIYKAAEVLGGNDRETADYLARQVELYLVAVCHNDMPSVEQIQDAVERILIENGHARTAKEFILYRAERTRVRDMNTRLMKTYAKLTFSDLDPEKQNDVTAMEMMLKYGSEGARQFYEMFVLKPEYAKANREGDIHIHDLEYLTLSTSSCLIDLQKLFNRGFTAGNGQVREPNDIWSYASLACIAIQSNQNDQHGSQGIPAFDYAMAEGVRKTYRKMYWNNMGKMLDFLFDIEDAVMIEREIGRSILQENNVYPMISDDNRYKLIEREHLKKLIGEKYIDPLQIKTTIYSLQEIDRACFQAMEALIHNLNVLCSKAGAQIPKSSIGFGTDRSPEGRLISENILKVLDQGIGHGMPAEFPTCIFKVKEGVNYSTQDTNYDLLQLALKVAAGRGIPNFSFLDAPFNRSGYVPGKPDSEAAYTAECGRIMENAYHKENQTVNGRGNLSTTTINLPRIGIKSHGDAEWFFEELERKLDLTVEQLLERYNIQTRKKAGSYPFLMGQHVWIGSENLGESDLVTDVLGDGTLCVGFIGLAECLKALTGSHQGEAAESLSMGMEIIGFMRKKLDETSSTTGLNFNLMGSCNKELAKWFLEMDREKYGLLSGITDKACYTDSFHIPEDFHVDPYEKIRKEAPFHSLTNGGHICTIECSTEGNEETADFEKILRFMKECGIGYGSIKYKKKG